MCRGGVWTLMAWGVISYKNRTENRPSIKMALIRLMPASLHNHKNDFQWRSLSPNSRSVLSRWKIWVLQGVFLEKLCKRSLVFVCRKGHRASFIWKLPPYVSLRLLLVILTLIVQLYWETSYSKSSTRGPWSASSTFPAGQAIVTREFMVKKAPWNKTSWYLMSIAYWQLVKIIHGKNVTVQSPPI